MVSVGVMGIYGSMALYNADYGEPIEFQFPVEIMGTLWKDFMNSQWISLGSMQFQNEP